MKDYIKIILSICLVFATTICLAASPAGKWRTIDDESGKMKSIVLITVKGDRLSGRILKIFPEPGKTPNPVCKKCSGANKNRPIVGMTFLYNMKQDKDNPNEWSGGSILDPKSGTIYRCHIKVSDDGRKLEVHGYVGISLFGRTQTWIRN